MLYAAVYSSFFSARFNLSNDSSFVSTISRLTLLIAAGFYPALSSFPQHLMPGLLSSLALLDILALLVRLSRPNLASRQSKNVTNSRKCLYNSETALHTPCIRLEETAPLPFSIFPHPSSLFHLPSSLFPLTSYIFPLIFLLFRSLPNTFSTFFLHISKKITNFAPTFIL